MGVWVLPEEYRKIGFFYEMDSGRCFRIERRAFERNGYMILRQTTEVGGQLSFVSNVKVSNDPESQPIPVHKLCKDPYSEEVQRFTENLLAQGDVDKTLCYNNFTDPCPQLTKEQVAACKGFDYGDKTLKLPMGPLPWPAGCPEPGYVPKTNPLHGRWITVRVASPHSSRRPSRLVCLAPQRPKRSWRTQTMRRLAVCICVSTNSATSAPWMHPWPSTREPNAPGVQAIISTSLSSRAATSWAYGCCPRVQKDWFLLGDGLGALLPHRAPRIPSWPLHALTSGDRGQGQDLLRFLHRSPVTKVRSE